MTLKLFWAGEGPVFPLRFRERLAALINYSATMAIGFVLSLYLQYIKGMTPQTAGLILLAQPAMMVMFSPLAGRLSDRVEPRILASSGMGILTVGLLLLAGCGAGTSSAFIVIVLLVLGFGFALFSSPNTNAVMGAVDKRAYGVASALLATMRLTGENDQHGPGHADLRSPDRPGPHHPGSSSRVPLRCPDHLLFVRGLCLAGLFASLARGTIHDQNNRPTVKEDA